MQKILVIEDEADIQEFVCAYLRDAGYEAAAAGDGVSGLSCFSQEHWDLVILDLMLPKIDGYAVCELIRKQSDVPIIMLTALDGEINQIKGYDLRIDDYVTKPFSMSILLRKIAAVLRRYESKTDAGAGADAVGVGVGAGTGEGVDTENIINTYANKLIYKDISVDLDSYEVFVGGNCINLTKREFEILREFIEHPGKVHTRTKLLDSLWGYEYYGDERIVDSHIKNLRKKLDRDYVETVRGVGYRVAKIEK